MGAGFNGDGEIVITPHLHSIIMNVHAEKFSYYFRNRKSSKGIKGAKPLKCVEIPTDRDLIRVAHYITKFEYFMSVPKFYGEGLRRIFNSNETMPLGIRISIDDWMSEQTPQNLFSFVNVPRSKTNWFYRAQMNSIIPTYLKNVEKIVGNEFDW